MANRKSLLQCCYIHSLPGKAQNEIHNFTQPFRKWWKTYLRALLYWIKALNQLILNRRIKIKVGRGSARLMKWPNMQMMYCRRWWLLRLWLKKLRARNPKVSYLKICSNSEVNAAKLWRTWSTCASSECSIQNYTHNKFQKFKLMKMLNSNWISCSKTMFKLSFQS